LLKKGKYQRYTMAKRLATLTVAALLLAGCSVQPDVSMEKGMSLAEYRAVVVLAGVNETGSAENDSPAQTFGQDLRDALSEEQLNVKDVGTVQDALVVKPILVHYEPGSALARWILPGLGRTQATASAALIDQKTGKSVGTVSAADQVSSGGLYSIGQYRLILSRLAKGIANEIAKRLHETAE
jgi:hypothetical protein